MRPDVRALVTEAARALEAMARFTAAESASDYAADELLRAAVERQFIIVGEALAQLAHRDATTAARISGLPEAIGLRTVLVHGDVLLDDDLMWRTVEDDAPPLLEKLRALLDSPG